MKDLSKKELEQNGADAGFYLSESGEDTLPRFIEISRQIILLEAEKKALKEFALEEALLHGKDGLTLAGAKISVSNSGDRLQYGNDSVIVDLKRQLKDREQDLKIASKSNGTYFDDDGTEVVRVPIKRGSEILKVSF
jgi:hypothetical protein